MTPYMQEIFMFNRQEIIKKLENICVFGGGITGKKVVNFLKQKNKNVFANTSKSTIKITLSPVSDNNPGKSRINYQKKNKLVHKLVC